MTPTAQIILGRIPYSLCPTFDALSRVEQILNTGIIALAEKFADGSITLEEIVAIISCCLDAAIPEEEIKSSLICNLARNVEIIGNMLAAVLEGNGDDRGVSRADLEMLRQQFPDEAY